jgi:hypothetical protein
MPVGSTTKTSWEEQAVARYLLDPSTGLPVGSLASPMVRKLPQRDFLGGTSFTLDGSSPKWVNLAVGTTCFTISARGGEVFYNINGTAADQTSPGYIPEDSTVDIGPVCNMVRLWFFSGTAGTFAHVNCYSDGRTGGWTAPGWWDPNNEGLCVWAAYQPKGATSLSASYVDLSGNGNNCVAGVAPSWDVVNGWRFNDTTTYLTTTFVPQMDASQTMIIQFTNRVSVIRYIAGMRDADDMRFAISPFLNTGRAYYNGIGQQVAGSVSSGNLCVSGVQGYLNGAADGAAFASAWGGVATSQVYIGCWNNSGSQELHCDVDVQAFALYSCELTSSQVSAIAAAMATL